LLPIYPVAVLEQARVLHRLLARRPSVYLGRNNNPCGHYPQVEIACAKIYLWVSLPPYAPRALKRQCVGLTLVSYVDTTATFSSRLTCVAPFWSRREYRALDRSPHRRIERTTQPTSKCMCTYTSTCTTLRQRAHPMPFEPSCRTWVCHTPDEACSPCLGPVPVYVGQDARPCRP
jgi:hypothetical protein